MGPHILASAQSTSGAPEHRFPESKALPSAIARAEPFACSLPVMGYCSLSALSDAVLAILPSKEAPRTESSADTGSFSSFRSGWFHKGDPQRSVIEEAKSAFPKRPESLFVRGLRGSKLLFEIHHSRKPDLGLLANSTCEQFNQARAALHCSGVIASPQFPFSKSRSL